MTTEQVRAPGPPQAATGRYLCTPGEDLVTALLGACLVGGALTDAWVHTNRASTLESFFTPWHALLYGGFAAIAAWTFWLALRRRASTPRWWRDGWPVGYGIGAVGVIGFMAGGLFDMLWHTIFGIEVSLDAAFSPSHLLLSYAGVLLLTSPVRSWWATGGRGVRAAAGVLSLALGTVFGSVVLIAVSAFASTAPTREYDFVLGSMSHLDATLGVACYLITTVVLVMPLLLAHRRQPMPGTATAIVAAVSLFTCVTKGLPGTLTAAAAGAIAGAALADVALLRLDAVRGTDAVLRLPIAGALFATLVWTGHLLAMHLADGLRWPAELVSGSVVFAAVIGFVLGNLAAAPKNTAAVPA